jgi:hypothetical protein
MNNVIRLVIPRTPAEELYDRYIETFGDGVGSEVLRESLWGDDGDDTHIDVDDLAEWIFSFAKVRDLERVVRSILRVRGSVVSVERVLANFNALVGLTDPNGRREELDGRSVNRFTP